eukprot:NODE_2126_length_2287_cov_7.325926.p1 GENE.NODE_2126_length_2287_cov_7.325926~~NODE_2126_length_2287_cov_7.325926.p1  ORF type:complete len:616 (+),score=139.73 NODE_2126_length_2287_cov_7.325926:155-1849(+)
MVADSMVEVMVHFSYAWQRWTHTYVVDAGTTVKELKATMLQPEGEKHHVDAFELQRNGRRVGDREQLVEDIALYFEYFGEEEGARRAKLDASGELARVEWPKPAAHVPPYSPPPGRSGTRLAPSAAPRAPMTTTVKTVAAELSVSTAAKPAPKPASQFAAPATLQAPKATPASAPAPPVNITIRDALDAKGELALEVSSSCTILELRQMVMNALGLARLSKVKLVQRVGENFVSWRDTDTVGEECEFYSLDVDLSATAARPGTSTTATPATAPAVASSAAAMGSEKLTVTVILDRPTDLRTTLQVPRGTKISVLKARMAAQDVTGRTSPHSFGLALPPQAERGKPIPLADGTVLTDRHTLLECVVPSAGPTTWEVVGGVGKGGIIVRKGLQTSSPQCDTRLSTGATLQELELVGERLCYELLTGTGPPTGWVSLSFQGKDLVAKRASEGAKLAAAAAAAPAADDNPLTLELAQNLQQDLLHGFSAPDFQRKLKDLKALHPSQSGMQYQTKRSALFLSVQAPILPRYGFEGTSKGAVLMFNSFAEFMNDSTVRRNGERLNELLGM